MQSRNKAGSYNPQSGVIKSPDTIAKLTKLVYVYSHVDMIYIGSYSTVQCSKEFKLAKDTLSKYLLNGRKKYFPALSYIIFNLNLPL